MKYKTKCIFSRSIGWMFINYWSKSSSTSKFQFLIRLKKAEKAEPVRRKFGFNNRVYNWIDTISTNYKCLLTLPSMILETGDLADNPMILPNATNLCHNRKVEGYSRYFILQNLGDW